MVSLLVLVMIIGLPSNFGYNFDYKAFDDCGIRGWHCDRVPEGLMVTYKCDAQNPNARIWWWTARVPSTTIILAVENCSNLEIHPDCTVGYRAYALQEFRIVNVESVQILKPLKPYIFLHDNDELAHVPPSFSLVNVTKFVMPPNLFDRAKGRCRTKGLFMSELNFDNVNLDVLGSEMLKNLSMKRMVWHQVKVKETEKNAVQLKATEAVIIKNSTFGSLVPNTFSFEAKEVSFMGNIITELYNNGITVLATKFQFSENAINTLREKSLNVLARVISIEKNNFTVIKSNAFEQLIPGYKSEGFEIAQKYEFQFNGNQIGSMADDALDSTFQTYAKICSNVSINGNSIPCTCPNLPLSSHRESIFFKDFNTSQDNFCKDYPECSFIKLYTLYSNGNCSGDVDFKNCSAVNATKPIEEDIDISTTEPSTDTPAISTTQKSSTTTQSSVINAQSQSEAKSMPVVVPVVCILVLILFVGAFLFYNKRYGLNCSRKVNLHARHSTSVENLIEETSHHFSRSQSPAS